MRSTCQKAIIEEDERTHHPLQGTKAQRVGHPPRCADSLWSDVAFPERQAEEQPSPSGTVEEVEEWAR